MSDGVRIGLTLLLAYLLGAVPFSVMVSKWFYKKDVRKFGSGNAGATNVLRVLGTGAGVSVLMLDIAKGAGSVLIAKGLASVEWQGDTRDWLLIGAAFLAVVGHSFSIFIGMGGGKGVATAAGALLVITPKVWPFMLVLFLLVVILTKMVSAGSITVATAFPLSVLILYHDRHPIVYFSFLVAAFVLWRHRGNMKRILKREELKLGERRDLLRAGIAKARSVGQAGVDAAGTDVDQYVAPGADAAASDGRATDEGDA